MGYRVSETMIDLFAGVTDFVAYMAASRPWIGRLIVAVVAANIIGGVVYLVTR